MSRAILTKVLPATNSRPTRIKAQAERGSIVVSHDFAGPLDSEATHRAAAHALIRKFLYEDKGIYGTEETKNPWARPFVTGCLPSGEFCHVFTK